MNEKILCAGVWFNDGAKYENQPHNIESGFVVAGRRHMDCFNTAYILRSEDEIDNIKEIIHGFITSDNRFLDRKDAAYLAKKSGQINETKRKLFSDDLY